MIQLFSNEAISTLANPVGVTSTTMTITNATQFPVAVNGVSFFALTLTDAATQTIFEIVYCTARTGNVLTVQRGQEGTPAISWAAGAIVYNSATAGTLANFAQGSVLSQGVFIPAPSGQNLYTFNTYSSMTLEAACQPKPAPGSLYGLNVNADSGVPANCWVLGIDSATAPINGPVTPLCWGKLNALGVYERPFPGFPIAFQAGMNFCLSTTGPFTLTLSAHAAFEVNYL